MKIASMKENTTKQTECKDEWIERAKAVGLDDNATKAQVIKAEKKDK